MEMSIIRNILTLALLSSIAAQAQPQSQPPTKTYNIDKVVVRGRPLQDIGVQQTRIDTLVLQDLVVSASMSDILAQNSTVFIKSFGRATLSTASFRGTSASHTQVTWNGMNMNSPMLGMVDFSMIPSYFIDDATLLHGTSSVNVTGGGLGGAIALSTRPTQEQGFGAQYIQGISSFRTFDEFLRLTYGSRRWQTSTRVAYASSPNRFKYRNYKKRVNEVWDDDRNLVSFDYPMERNRSGRFDDLHILQETYYNAGKGNRLGLSAWYMDSKRGVPMLNVDHKEEAEYDNRQSEQTFRGVLSWELRQSRFNVAAKGGYVNTRLGYDYSRDLGNGERIEMIRSRSRVNTAYALADFDYTPGRRFMLTANISAHQHFVESADKNVISQNGQQATVGYDKARIELSGYLSAKWKPTDRFGVSLALREEMYGQQFAPIVPAGFMDYLLSRKGNIFLKASVSRNYRFPTLNDLYFLPGGNPALRPERGFTYDAGAEFRIAPSGGGFNLNGELTGFDSYIRDWIIWLPTFKGFWSPSNIKRVHAYGVEAKASADWHLSSRWALKLDGNYSWTPSINHGDPANWADASIGKQLVYVPRHSSAITGRVTYMGWRFTYKWSWYSERFTTSSNETATRTGVLMPYFMSDISLEKRFTAQFADFSVKGVLNNLFNEEYETVLSHPMPRMNYQLFIEIKPRFGRKKH